MRARNRRDRRARRGRYVLRDLAGFADIERLLAADVNGERRAPLMLPMMMRPPTSLCRRRLLGRSQEAVCEGEGEHLADLLGHRRCQRSPGDGPTSSALK